MQMPTCLVHCLGLVPYEQAWKLQDELAAQIAAGQQLPTLLLLEHPHTYTFGRRGKEQNLLWSPAELEQHGVAVYWVDRGGDVTYHGPGQRVAYVMLDLRERGRDVTKFVQNLEHWIIGALADFNVKGEIRDGRVGVWVERKGPGWSREDKIAAIGVRVQRGVTMHGFALNVDPDLVWFDRIVPCGITDAGVTSLADEVDGPAPGLVEVARRLEPLLAELLSFEPYQSSPDCAALPHPTPAVTMGLTV